MTATSLKANLLNHYDRRMYIPVIEDFYNGSDFFNYGYWFSDTQSPQEASENLMEELLALIPEKRGSILDVACGKGATTQYLTRYYDETNIAGINISDVQLESCRKNAPACTFYNMSATELIFDDHSFDAVICVEAAPHFDTREQFLYETYRILAKGGHLTLSDVLLPDWAALQAPLFVLENHLKAPDEYETLLKQIGFRNIVVDDVTEQTWISFLRYRANILWKKLQSGQIGFAMYKMALFNLRMRYPSIKHYLLVGAQKP